MSLPYAGRAIMNSLPSSLTFFTEQPWAIPVIGMLVTGLAFLMGRRWLGARPDPPKEKPAEEQPLTPLATMTTLKSNKPQPDRRAAPRRKAGSRVEVYLTDDPKEPPILAWVVDRSMGGLCLNVEEQLSEGTTLYVRPRKAQQTAPWLAIEVRSCRPDGSVWEIGCRFLKPPQWNDLLLFG